jgi:hypothetical protein
MGFERGPIFKFFPEEKLAGAVGGNLEAQVARLLADFYAIVTRPRGDAILMIPGHLEIGEYRVAHS